MNPQSDPNSTNDSGTKGAGVLHDVRPYVFSMLVIAACTAVAWLMLPLFELANIAMIYVLGIVLVATRWGRGPSIVATVIGVAAFDYLYVPPYFDLLSNERKYVVMFAVMLVVGITISALTERARAREHEADRAKTTVELEKQRNALLSVVSHDLRTPLAAITGAASVLLDSSSRVDRQTERELLDSIQEESARLQRLVSNLLDVTKLESGALQPRCEWQQVEEMVGAAANHIEKTMREHRLNLDIAPNLPLVLVDAVLLQQVLINLLENAAKYAPKGSPILLRARQEGSSLVLEVEDQGPGLAAGEEERVFEKFRRGSAVASWGTGLGLTICKGIVDAHGGRILASNRAAGGALFRVELPLGGSPPSVPTED